MKISKIINISNITDMKDLSNFLKLNSCIIDEKIRIQLYEKLYEIWNNNKYYKKLNIKVHEKVIPYNSLLFITINKFTAQKNKCYINVFNRCSNNSKLLYCIAIHKYGTSSPFIHVLRKENKEAVYDDSHTTYHKEYYDYYIIEECKYNNIHTIEEAKDKLIQIKIKLVKNLIPEIIRKNLKYYYNVI